MSARARPRQTTALQAVLAGLTVLAGIFSCLLPNDERSSFERPVLLLDGQCWDLLHPRDGDGIVLELRGGRLQRPEAASGS